MALHVADWTDHQVVVPNKKAVLRIRIRRIRTISLDSDPYQKLGWIRIRIK